MLYIESLYVNVIVSLTLNNAHIVSSIDRVCLGMWVNSCSSGTIPMGKKSYIVKSVIYNTIYPRIRTS